jgi:predicted flap endonuclease-1-like 5' DNA nuclease
VTPLPRIGKPATRALAESGVTTLEAVATYSERQLLAIHGIGPKAIRILALALAELGLQFRPDQRPP